MKCLLLSTCNFVSLFFYYPHFNAWKSTSAKNCKIIYLLKRVKNSVHSFDQSLIGEATKRSLSSTHIHVYSMQWKQTLNTCIAGVFCCFFSPLLTLLMFFRSTTHKRDCNMFLETGKMNFPLTKAEWPESRDLIVKD